MSDDRHIPSPEELAKRLSWFAAYTDGSDREPADLPLRCPCCACVTLSERSGYEICPVCFWEDDGQDDHDADVVRGGPNGGLSLTQARQNYCQLGACEERHVRNVRPPQAGELPQEGQEGGVAVAPDRKSLAAKTDPAPSSRPYQGVLALAFAMLGYLASWCMFVFPILAAVIAINLLVREIADGERLSRTAILAVFVAGCMPLYLWLLG